MSTELVGLEVLPNVYINKITLHKSSTSSYLARAHVYVVDEIGDNLKHHWSDDKILMNNLKFMFMSVESEQYIQAISRGAYNIKELMSLEMASDNQVTTQYKNVNNCKKIVRERKTHFKNIFEFKVTSEGMNQAIFCCLILENSMASFKIEELDKYSMTVKGPTTSEHVIIRGNLPSEAHVFYKEDGTQWAGPIHYHPDRGYMEGASHSDRQHGLLTKTKVMNLKILNNININFKPKKRNLSKRNMHSTDLWLSLGPLGGATGLFAINFKNILRRKTKYGNSLYNISDREYQDLIRKIKIYNLSVIRHQVKNEMKTGISEEIISSFTDSDNDFLHAVKITKGVDRIVFPSLLVNKTTAMDESSNQVFLEDLSALKQKSSISQVMVNIDKDAKLYKFVDNDLGILHEGDFKYEFDLQFSDPTIEYVETLITNTRDLLRELEDYNSRIRNEGNYDFDLDSIKADFISAESQTYSDDLSRAPWVATPKDYIKKLKFFYELDDSQIKFVENSVFSLLHPKTATLSSINIFINRYKKLVKKFYNHFDLTPHAINKTRTHNIKRPIAKDPRLNLIKIKKMFNKIAKTSDYEIFYNFINLPGSPNLTSVAKTLLLNRSTQVKNDLALGSIGLNEICLVPASVQKLNNTIPIMVNFDENYVRGLNKIFENLTTEIVSPYSVQVIPQFTMQELEEGPPLIPSRDFLGDESKFNDVEDKPGINCEIEYMQNNLTTNEISSHTGYEIPANSSLSAFLGGTPQLEKYRILVGEKNLDIIHYTLHMQVHNVEVLDGFRKDNDGNTILKEPIWRVLAPSDLNTESGGLLCRIKKRHVPELKDFEKGTLYHRTNLNNDINKYFFAISGINDLNEDEALQVEQSDSYNLSIIQSLNHNIDLGTTNLIRQVVTVDSSKQPLNLNSPIPIVEDSFDEVVNVIGTFDAELFSDTVAFADEDFGDQVPTSATGEMQPAATSTPTQGSVSVVSNPSVAGPSGPSGGGSGGGSMGGGY